MKSSQGIYKQMYEIKSRYIEAEVPNQVKVHTDKGVKSSQSTYRQRYQINVHTGKGIKSSQDTDKGIKSSQGKNRQMYQIKVHAGTCIRSRYI